MRQDLTYKMEKTIEQKIGMLIRDRRERKEDEQKFIDVLRNKGYKDEEFESMFSDDLNIFGHPKKYQVRYSFGKPFICQGNERYALVPVHLDDGYNGDENDRLVLVDRKENKKLTVANAGNRGVHYSGRARFKPLAVLFRDGKAIISYKFILHADLKDPIKVSESIWEDFLFWHSQNCITEVNLSKLEKQE